MIPKNITRKAVIKAIHEIDKNGIPKNRLSTKYNIFFEGKQYPPKYVISLANRIENGVELKAEDFGGGHESNSFLMALGFDIKGGNIHGTADRLNSGHSV